MMTNQQMSSTEVKFGTCGGLCFSLLSIMSLERVLETIFLAAIGAVVSLLVSRLMQRLLKKKK